MEQYERRKDIFIHLFNILIFIINRNIYNMSKQSHLTHTRGQ